MINVYFWDTNHYITDNKDSRFTLIDSKARMYVITFVTLEEYAEIMNELIVDYDFIFKQNKSFASGLYMWVDKKGKVFKQR